MARVNVGIATSSLVLAIIAGAAFAWYKNR